jgi:signal transduction histidine kinase
VSPCSSVEGPQHSTPDLIALSDYLERMREEERTRIARELHDELGQLLTGIKLDFGSTLRRLRELKAPLDVVDRLQSAAGQIDIGIEMVRRIAGDLRPPLLDHHDLGGAIEFEAKKHAARSGLRIRVSSRVSRAVPPELATATFRIFQESLTNAVRHSGASSVVTRLTITRRELHLFVRDNGVGISEERLHSGQCLGLLGMRERARALGGEVQIKGKRGHGTILAMTLPLRAD